MNAKALLIPVAALALCATSVSAFDSAMLREAGLSQEQIAAFTLADELRRNGDKDAARDVIIEANIDLKALESMRRVLHAHKDELHRAINAAIEADDFAAFKAAVSSTPLADIVVTRDDFELFKQAHLLHSDIEREDIKQVLDELGLHHQTQML